MMFHMNLSKYLWGDVVLTASYLINRMPTRVLQYTTPLNCLKQFFPESCINSDLPLKVFGCTAFMHLPNRSRFKLDPQADKCDFLGYAPKKKGYKYFNPLTKTFHVTMNANFLENQPFFHKNLIQGKKLEESIFWETEPLPQIVLYPTEIDKETRITQSGSTEFDIGLSDMEILRIEKKSIQS